MFKQEDDVVWERVLGLLSENGRLARFYKIPRHEMRAYMKIGGADAWAYLTLLFSLVHRNENLRARELIQTLEVKHIYPIILILVRSIKCWVETENYERLVMETSLGRHNKWKIAHA